MLLNVYLRKITNIQKYQIYMDKNVSWTFLRRNISSFLKSFFLGLYVIKGAVSIISSDPPCKEGNARFTTVPLKPWCVRWIQRYVCVNLLKPACIQLQIQVCAVLSYVHFSVKYNKGSKSLKTHISLFASTQRFLRVPL